MTQIKRALQLLSDSGADFVVIGGVAANIHGSAYVTYDLDICYSRAATNVQKLAATLAPLHPRPRGFPPDLPFVWDAATLRNATVLTLVTDLGDLDLLAEVAGVGGFEAVLRHSVVIQAFDRSLRTLDLQRLIEAKRAAGRPKDLALVVELESILEATDPSPDPEV